MKKLKKIGKIVLVLFYAGVAWTAWATFALYDLTSALSDDDPVALERRIEWSGVREGLREDLGTASEPAGRSRATERYSSTQAVVKLLRTARFEDQEAIRPEGSASGPLREFAWYRIRYAFFTGGPFAFRVEIQPDTDKVRRPIILLFKWSGDWRLTRVFLPADARFDQASALLASQAWPEPEPPSVSASKPPPAAPPSETPKVVLFEEDPNDKYGKRYEGSVVWRAEPLPPDAGGAQDVEIKAYVDCPDRQIKMTLAMRRNTDSKLPATHTIEVRFDLPPNSHTGGIQNVPGIMMKQSIDGPSTRLAGLSVQVSPNFFLIGLSAIEIDAWQNLQLLKERSWFDVLIEYKNKQRAVLGIEKGETGARIIAEAFSRWETAQASAKASSKK